jgi:peptide deformylase
MNLIIPENSKELRELTPAWDFAAPPEEAQPLVAIMYATMRMENGVGLAAPQIGKNHRIFIMGDDTSFKACFNPEILKFKGDVVLNEEGCLSFPGLLLKVKRSSEIDVRYWNQDGELLEESLSGLQSICFQHELDHLDGICFDQRVGTVSLAMAKNRRAKALKGKR